MSREQRLERALVMLMNAVTERNRMSEFDECRQHGRRHQQIDFTGAQLRKIGKALRLGREALAALLLLAVAPQVDAQSVVYTNVVNGRPQAEIVRVVRVVQPAAVIPSSIRTTEVLPRNYRPPIGPRSYEPPAVAAATTTRSQRQQRVTQPWFINGIYAGPSPNGLWTSTSIGRPIVDVHIVSTQRSHARRRR